MHGEGGGEERENLSSQGSGGGFLPKESLSLSQAMYVLGPMSITHPGLPHRPGPPVEMSPVRYLAYLPRRSPISLLLPCRRDLRTWHFQISMLPYPRQASLAYLFQKPSLSPTALDVDIPCLSPPDLIKPSPVCHFPVPKNIKNKRHTLFSLLSPLSSVSIFAQSLDSPPPPNNLFFPNRHQLAFPHIIPGGLLLFQYLVALLLSTEQTRGKQGRVFATTPLD